MHTLNGTLIINGVVNIMKKSTFESTSTYSHISDLMACKPSQHLYHSSKHSVSRFCKKYIDTSVMQVHVYKIIHKMTK